MRYRRELGLVRMSIWGAFGIILASNAFREGYPLWTVCLIAVLVALSFYVPYLFWYWEIYPDRLIHRRYFQQIIFPFSEITYVGPMTGNSASHKSVRNWILVQNTDGRSMIVQSAVPEAFLSQMRKYLPEITLNH